MKKSHRVVISKSKKRHSTPKGSGVLNYTEQVVYKVPMGKMKGKMKYKSLTKHEIVRK